MQNDQMSAVKIIRISKEIISFHIDVMKRILSQEENSYWDINNFLIDLPGKWENSYVAIKNSTPVGFIFCSKKNEETLHVHKLFIEEKFQGLGLATQLLKECLQNAKEFCRFCTLYVYTSKKNAVLFYKNKGFEINMSLKDNFGEKYFLKGEIIPILKKLA